MKDLVMVMFLVTTVAVMEGISISEEQSAYICSVEAKYKCGGLDNIGLKEDP